MKLKERKGDKVEKHGGKWLNVTAYDRWLLTPDFSLYVIPRSSSMRNESVDIDTYITSSNSNTKIMPFTRITSTLLLAVR